MTVHQSWAYILFIRVGCIEKWKTIATTSHCLCKLWFCASFLETLLRLRKLSFSKLSAQSHSHSIICVYVTKVQLLVSVDIDSALKRPQCGVLTCVCADESVTTAVPASPTMTLFVWSSERSGGTVWIRGCVARWPAAAAIVSLHWCSFSLSPTLFSVLRRLQVTSVRLLLCCSLYWGFETVVFLLTAEPHRH